MASIAQIPASWEREFGVAATRAIMTAALKTNQAGVNQNRVKP